MHMMRREAKAAAREKSEGRSQPKACGVLSADRQTGRAGQIDNADMTSQRSTHMSFAPRSKMVAARLVFAPLIMICRAISKGRGGAG